MNSDKQKSFQCDDCKLDFNSHLKLANHKYDAHLNSLAVYLENEIEPIIINRCDSKFTCPECSSKLNSPTTFRRHLKKHNAYCQTTSKGNRRQNSETDNDNNSSSLPLKHQKIAVPHFNLGKQTSSSKAVEYDKDTSVLIASNATGLSATEREKCLMLTKVGGWEPIMLLAQNGKAYHYLASPDNFDQLLLDQPSGKWMLPKPTNVSTESALRHSDDLFHLITSTSPFYKFISNQSYIEISKDIVETLNNDWTFNPQLRFACSQAFAGAILLEGFTAIIINCVEPYGRLKKTDAHHERRLESSMYSSSYPQTESKYGWISSVIVEEDNVTKLKIGTTSFNLLVTSSIRLDNKPNTQDIIQMGSKTTSFVPTINTSIYLDKKSIELANSLLDNQATVSINQQNRLFQLKQIRSKFDCLSSYTMCRSFSTIATNMMFRPYTIFTLCEYDSPQVIESQAQKLSTMFQSIALSVINDGAAATVSVDVFQKAHDQVRHDSTAAPIISQIVALSEYGRIRIINNTALDSLLQPLAKSMATSIRNANNIAVKLLSRHLQT